MQALKKCIFTKGLKIICGGVRQDKLALLVYLHQCFNDRKLELVVLFVWRVAITLVKKYNKIPRTAYTKKYNNRLLQYERYADKEHNFIDTNKKKHLPHMSCI